MINYTQCSPRRLKKIATESLPTNEDKKTLAYEFYRLLVEPSIIRQKNEKDKINYSQWLIRLDNEDSDLKLHLIKILFISLQNNRTLYVFLNPPPEDLSELNLFDDDNTMEMVKKIQVITNNFYANEEIVQEIEYKRSAAVATDMCSYSTIKTSKHIVQSFYVKSDFPIQMWYNPSNIVLPHSFDHNEWEQYLNHFEIAIKNTNIDDDKHKNTCESIFNEEQISKEVDSGCIFRWHPHSKLFNKDRPKRLAAFVDVDADISNQPFTQKQIDENALNIVHNKSFPGYKILNPNFYSTVLMPDPKFVFNTTGVRIIHNKIAHASFVNTEQKNQLKDSYKKRKPKVSCSTRKQDIDTEVNCTNSERSSTNSTCTSKSTTQQLSCSITTHNSDDNVQDSCNDPNSYKQTSSDKSENNCQLIQQNNTCPESCCEPPVDSKCVSNSLGSEWCRTISKTDTNMSSNDRKMCCLDGQSENRLEDSCEERKAKAICSTRKQDTISEVNCTNSERSSTNSTCTAKSTTQQLSCSITKTQKYDDNVQDSCTDSNSYKQTNSDESENNCQLIQQNDTCPESGCEPPVDSKCVSNSLGSEWCRTISKTDTNMSSNDRKMCCLDGQSENRLEDSCEERKAKAICLTKKQDTISEVNCTNSERSSTNSTCTAKSTTQQLSCSITKTQKCDDNVQDSCTDSNSYKQTSSDKSENNCQLIEQNDTRPESGCEPPVDLKCVNNSLGSEWCPKISKIDTNVLSSNNRKMCCLDGQSENRLEDSYEERKAKAICSTRKQDTVSEVNCTNSERSSTNSTCTAKSTTQQLSCSITKTQKCDDNVQDSCTDSNSYKQTNSDKSENNCQFIQQDNTCRESGCESPVDSKCADKSLGSEWCQTKSEIGANNGNVCQSENRGNSIGSETRVGKCSKTTNANDGQPLDDSSDCESSVAGSRPPAKRNTSRGPAGLSGETTSKRDGRVVVQTDGRTEKLSAYRCHDRSVVSVPACDENWEPAEIVGGYAEFANGRGHCRRTSSEVGLSTRPDDKTADDDDETADDDDDDTSDWSDDRASSSDSLTTLTSYPSDSFCSSADGRWPVFESSTSLSDRSDYTNAGIPCPFDTSRGRENDDDDDDDDDSSTEYDCLENVSMPEYTSFDDSLRSSDMSRMNGSAGDMRRRDSFDSLDTDGR